jgi:hypothetical protein
MGNSLISICRLTTTTAAFASISSEIFETNKIDTDHSVQGLSAARDISYVLSPTRSHTVFSKRASQPAAKQFSPNLDRARGKK